jgi:hypothetical protein
MLNLEAIGRSDTETVNPADHFPKISLHVWSLTPTWRFGR